MPRAGFRPLRVIARRDETAGVTSFMLEPVEPEGWRDFQAGQFLSFRLPAPDARGKMLRNYSLASSPDDKGRYEICVSRDSAQTSGRGGQGAFFFHESVQVGDILYADGPRGNFALRDSGRPVLLVSADIGITPLIAMLRVLAAKNHPVTFIHECEDEAAHIMRAGIAALAARSAKIRPVALYRAAGQSLDSATLAPLLPGTDCDVYLCGPTPFMQRAWAALRGHGIAPQSIAHEFFGPMIDLERDFQTRGIAPM